MTSDHKRWQQTKCRQVDNVNITSCSYSHQMALWTTISVASWTPLHINQSQTNYSHNKSQVLSINKYYKYKYWHS